MVGSDIVFLSSPSHSHPVRRTFPYLVQPPYICMSLFPSTSTIKPGLDLNPHLHTMRYPFTPSSSPYPPNQHNPRPPLSSNPLLFLCPPFPLLKPPLQDVPLSGALPSPPPSPQELHTLSTLSSRHQRIRRQFSPIICATQDRTQLYSPMPSKPQSPPSPGNLQRPLRQHGQPVPRRSFLHVLAHRPWLSAPRRRSMPTSLRLSLWSRTRPRRCARVQWVEDKAGFDGCRGVQRCVGR